MRLLSIALLFAGCTEYELSHRPDPATAFDTATGPSGTVPDGVPTGGITGRVCAPDTNTWVAAALVYVDHDWGRTSTKTDGDGWFTLEGLPLGTHEVQVEKGSFSTSFTVEVFADVITELSHHECLEQGDVEIVVVTGEYDDIGALISGLNLSFDTVNGVTSTEYIDFLRDPNWMGQYDIIFFNCGMGFDWTEHQAEVVDNLKQYVRDGGSVYASDWAYYLVEATWPAQQVFHGNDATLGAAFVGETGLVNATVFDSSMQAVLGSDTAEINYDLGAWAAMVSANGEVLIEGDYPYYDGFSLSNRTAPLAYRMSDGGGTALYTTFHNERQTTVDMALILQDIILSL